LKKKSLADSFHESKNNIVLIGPEGDFSKNELKDAQINGFKFVTLGNSRLRAETAGIMTCAIFSMI
jgi:RNA methyltransferase, RsmE family